MTSSQPRKPSRPPRPLRSPTTSSDAEPGLGPGGRTHCPQWCVAAFLACTISCASDEHALRGGDNGNVWNLSPHAPIGVPDRALYACCPRTGGDMRIDGVVDGQGHMHDIRITRPPAPLGVLMGATCVVHDGFLVVADVMGEPHIRDEQQDVVRGCKEAEARMGGAFFPPAIPGTTQTCVERMAGAWSLTSYAARPVSITWECRP